MTTNVRYCIIGTGFSGTCVFWHLINNLTDEKFRKQIDLSNIEIFTVEKNHLNGPGYPYDKNNLLPSHFCNNQASTMAIHGNDFFEWMCNKKRYIACQFPELILETHPGIDVLVWEPEEDAFYPRELFGIYLIERFQEARNLALSRGIKVKHYQCCEAIDGYTIKNKFNLCIKYINTGEIFQLINLDKVLLSTGHWQVATERDLAYNQHYISSPYPPQLIKNKAHNSQILEKNDLIFYIQGMGPGAIDAIMTLCSDGEFIYDAKGLPSTYQSNRKAHREQKIKIVVGSRCGFFPAVRRPTVDLKFRFLTVDQLENLRMKNKGYIRMIELINLIDSELMHASNGKYGWHDIQHPKYPNAREKLIADLSGENFTNLAYSVLLKARRIHFYRYLSPQDKEFYDRFLDTHFIRTAVPIPASNANKLLLLIDAGILDTIKLGYGDKGAPQWKNGKFLVEYRSINNITRNLVADYVVVAIGQNFDLREHPSPLIKKLLCRGEIISHKEGNYLTGGITVNSRQEYRVLRKFADTQEYSFNLSAFGSIVQYWQNENNFAAAFVEAAECVVTGWVKHTTEKLETSTPLKGII